MGSAARFFEPSGVAADRAGNVYVTDYNSIRKVTSAGVVTTLAGPAAGWVPSISGRIASRGSADGTGSAARFASPSGVAVDSAGNVYVADALNHKIRLGPPVLVTQPAFRPNTSLRLSDGQFQIEVTASINQLVLIQATSALPATNWITLQTITLWNGQMTLTDPGASNFPVRFYRAVSPVP
jgi:hypothetical protein